MAASQTVRGTAPGRAGKGKSVFISAPTFVNSVSIRKMLENEGARTVAADESGSGLTLPFAVAEGIKAADMAIGIVDGSSGSSQVFFEMGIARMREANAAHFAPNDS